MRETFGTLTVLPLSDMKAGDNLVVEPDHEGRLVVRRGLSIVAICEQPGDMLTEVQRRSNIAVGTLTTEATTNVSAMLTLS